MSGNGLWGNDSVGELTAGIDRIMKHLGMIDRSVKAAPQATPSFVTMWVPTAAATGLWYSAVEVGATVATGQALGRSATHSETSWRRSYRTSPAPWSTA